LEVVARLRSILKAKGLLRKLRNQHTFHNPTDAVVEAAFDDLSEAEDWSMLAGHSRHTILFPMSHYVTMQALIAGTGKTDIREAMELIRDEVLDAADALIAFFERLTIAMAEAHDLFFGQPIAVKDTDLLPDPTDIRIPPICRDRKNQT
jgi:hypothetical protein